MKIKKYTRDHARCHKIVYADASSHVSAGSIELTDEAPAAVEKAWKILREKCSESYGQAGIVVYQILWSYKDNGDYTVTIIGETPSIHGRVKAELPKFSVTYTTTMTKDVSGTHLQQLPVYPDGLEGIADQVAIIARELVGFVKAGTSQLSMDFDTGEDQPQETTPAETGRVVLEFPGPVHG